MNRSDHCAKTAEWSQRDQCRLGTASALLAGRCHGEDVRTMFGEPCVIVGEISARCSAGGNLLPPPTICRNLAMAPKPAE